MPPASKSYLLVEAISEAHVLNLCRHVSTIPQPARIAFIPLADRESWMKWEAPRPHTQSPSWVRFHPQYVLRQLEGVGDQLVKYGGDLAVVFEDKGYPLVDLLVVPRLPVKQRTRYKQLQRLLDPRTFPGARSTQEPINRYDPQTFWYPTRPPKLEEINPSDPRSVYRFKHRGYRDEYVLPFAVFWNVPVAAFVNSNVRPTFNELAVFFEGAVVTPDFGFEQMPKSFIRGSYEMFMGAPLEVGDHVKVEASCPPVCKRGVIKEIGFGGAVVYFEDEDHAYTFTNVIQHVRRTYQAGDAVKVIKSSDALIINRKGWVVDVNDDDVDVFDSKLQEEV